METLQGTISYTFDPGVSDSLNGSRCYQQSVTLGRWVDSLSGCSNVSDELEVRGV